MFVTSSFVTSIPAVAREFGSTPALINLAVSASIITTAFGMLVFSTYSAWYGRRPIFLTMLPILIIGSIGAAARSGTTLVTWRVVQAFGASGGFAVGAGVIADVFPLEQRGRATGIFYSSAFLEPVLAPFVCCTHYCRWRGAELRAIPGFNRGRGDVDVRGGQLCLADGERAQAASSRPAAAAPAVVAPVAKRAVADMQFRTPAHLRTASSRTDP
ncbi:MFS general substrate transporter [Peniophora sp. CONT]|nr:MFS general substrate transporter [Peniophora sp. CONT]